MPQEKYYRSSVITYFNIFLVQKVLFVYPSDRNPLTYILFQFSQSRQEKTVMLGQSIYGFLFLNRKNVQGHKFISLCPMQNEGLFNESWAAANALLNLHIVVTIYTSFSGDPHAYRRIFQPAYIVTMYIGTCEKYANA